MKKKIVAPIVALLALSSLLLLLAGGASHAKDNVAAPPASVQDNVSAPQRGTLFRVRPQHGAHGGTAYLFGTIHVGQPSFFPLGVEVTKAFAQADTLMVEFDIRKRDALLAATRKYAVYPNGDALDKHVSPATLDRLKRVLQDFGIPYASVAQMKPWMVANLLLGVVLERSGYEGRNGIDVFLLGQAEAQQKPVRELESADYQLSLFDAMPEKEQENYLAENLAELSSGKLMEKTQALTKAWRNADSAAFATISQEELDEKTTSADFMRRVMIDGRNPEMVQKIEAALQRKGSIFVGVGMLHLIGDGSIPELLRKHGYVVEKLY